MFLTLKDGYTRKVLMDFYYIQRKLFGKKSRVNVDPLKKKSAGAFIFLYTIYVYVIYRVIAELVKKKSKTVLAKRKAVAGLLL